MFDSFVNLKSVNDLDLFNFFTLDKWIFHHYFNNLSGVEIDSKNTVNRLYTFLRKDQLVRIDIIQ